MAITVFSRQVVFFVNCRGANVVRDVVSVVELVVEKRYWRWCYWKQ